MKNEFNEICNIIEALILSSDEILEKSKIRAILQDFNEDISLGEIDDAINELNKKYREANFSFHIKEVAGGYKYYLNPKYSTYAKYLTSIRKRRFLSKAALEVLAIIAYKQPITRAEIENIRGVNSDSVIKNLIEKHLVNISGRADEPGMPMLHSTTKDFLELLGINSLKDLPKLSEFEDFLKEDEFNDKEITIEALTNKDE